MRRLSPGLAVPLAGLAALVLASSARADGPTKAQCLSSNAAGQQLKREGKYRAARDALLACSVEACPELVRNDCAERLDEMQRLLPTLIFEVKSGDGADLAQVRITMDGEVLASKLDGTEIAVDPGEHTFVFETEGQAPVTEKLLVREGERGRRERITLGRPAAAEGAAHETPSRVPAIVLLSVGGAGILVGGITGAMALAKRSSLDGACQRHVCPPSLQGDIDSLAALSWVSTIGFGVGLVSAGIGTFLLVRASSDSQRTAGLRVVPYLGWGSAGAAGRF